MIYGQGTIPIALYYKHIGRGKTMGMQEPTRRRSSSAVSQQNSLLDEPTGVLTTAKAIKLLRFLGRLRSEERTTHP